MIHSAGRRLRPRIFWESPPRSFRDPFYRPCAGFFIVLDLAVDVDARLNEYAAIGFQVFPNRRDRRASAGPFRKAREAG